MEGRVKLSSSGDPPPLVSKTENPGSRVLYFTTFVHTWTQDAKRTAACMTQLHTHTIPMPSARQRNTSTTLTHKSTIHSKQ